MFHAELFTKLIFYVLVIVLRFCSCILIFNNGLLNALTNNQVTVEGRWYIAIIIMVQERTLIPHEVS